MTHLRPTANDGPERMVLTLILGDQLHRDWFSPSPLQLAAGSRVLMIEDVAVASTYRVGAALFPFTSTYTALAAATPYRARVAAA